MIEVTCPQKYNTLIYLDYMTVDSLGAIIRARYPGFGISANLQIDIVAFLQNLLREGEYFCRQHHLNILCEQ